MTRLLIEICQRCADKLMVLEWSKDQDGLALKILRDQGCGHSLEEALSLTPAGQA
jgi:hypothetical protein